MTWLNITGKLVTVQNSSNSLFSQIYRTSASHTEIIFRQNVIRIREISRFAEETLNSFLITLVQSWRC